MKVSIFSFACNTNFPIDLVRRQYVKYLKDDYEFIVFNDSSDPKIHKDIQTIAEYNKAKHVKVPQTMHKCFNPSGGYAETLNWSVHEYAAIGDFDIIVLTHTDIFPICQISMSEILGNYIVASTTEFRKIGDIGVSYLYPAFTIINMKSLKQIGVHELDFGLAPGVDTGGKTKDFIAKYPNSVKLLPNYQAYYFLRTLNDNESLAKYFKEDLDITRVAGLSSGWISEGGMYHYMCGSAWNANENSLFAQGHEKRMQLFLKYFY